MKKKFMFLAVAALFLSGGVFTAMQLTQKEKVSNLTLANIEAMTQRGDDDGGGFLNGPQDKYSCPGWFTGSGYTCLAEIDTNCEPVPCR